MEPLDFFYRNLGRHIAPNEPADQPDRPIRRAYTHPTKDDPRSAMRLGANPRDKALITPDRSTIWTSVRFESALPPHITQASQADMPDGRFLADILRNPPQPPFMVVQFVRNPMDLIQSLRICYSVDFITISGKTTTTIDRAIALTAIAAASGFDLKELLSTAALIQGRRADNAMVTDRALAARTEKTPGIVAAAKSYPLINTPEDWIVRIALRNGADDD